LKKSNIVYGFSSNKIEYYSCWEDIQVIQNALKIKKGDIVLSITSAGCNTLNSLLYNPKKIISIDFNPYQNYLLELKIKAIKNLDYEEFLNLLGIIKSKNPIKIYKSFRSQLDDKTKLFWDSNTGIIKKGLIYIGEPNVKFLGNIIRFLKGKDTLEGLFKCKTVEEQYEYFYKKIYGFPWRFLLKFSYNIQQFRFILCLRMLNAFHYRKKKSSEILKYIQRVTYPKNPIEQMEFILTKTPIINNYIASLMFLNRYYNKNFYPPYLKKKFFQILKERVNRIEVKTSSLENFLKDLPENYITKFNLSNIFDWFDEKEFKKILFEIKRVGVNGGRIFYTATRYDRDIPKSFKGIITEKKLESDLLKKDRTVLYSFFHVGNIKKIV
jgi:S-adenosylmethionine-diacylglycerol 3-amino-3-carboxypropyl transferase